MRTFLTHLVSSLTFAAMDTSSSAISRILYLLAEHQDVQDKLRSELLEAKTNNDGQELDYDQLMTLPYLDAVCRETLRRYASNLPPDVFH
jgi:cytochrome P450